MTWLTRENIRLRQENAEMARELRDMADRNNRQADAIKRLWLINSRLTGRVDKLRQMLSRQKPVVTMDRRMDATSRAEALFAPREKAEGPDSLQVDSGVAGGAT
ncbi:hypothetical protein SAMN05444339_10258 [Loktanella atrilutea]|uniref:Uncharacterized protein n=1 Tax=Loktanella atrilutea TaxID=366533 RepID=A0A1M4WBG7_LOKAT|nr:hypothetical protein [Loktanella atrilutea]SHE78611.1 hypothetical protein SAMN05444339_10258 [Loktanella atrilutea]